MRRALLSEPLHARPQLGVAQQVGHGACDLGGGMRIEQNRRPVGHFRHGRGLRAGYRAAAGHGFDDRQAEAFVERWEHEQVAGVVKVHQILVGHEAQETNAVRHA